METSALEGEYDLLVVLATWESRGAAVSKQSKISSRAALVVHFSPSHAPEHVIAAAADDLVAALNGRVNRLERLALSRSVDFYESLNTLARRVAELCRDLGRSPKVGIDISSLPIGYVQGLVALVLNAGISAQVDCFYVEPLYDDAKSIGSHTKFTSGSWQLNPVPYLEGKTIGTPEKYIFVCVGAESGNTRELLLGREYTQAAIMKPTGGKLSHLSEQVDRDCDELVSSVNMYGGTYAPANAFSVIDVARYYIESVSKGWRDAQRMFVAIGTKPHGLAGVICNVADPALAVFARVPTGYLVRDVEPSEHCWRYRLRDLSSPVWASKGFPSWN